MSRTIVYIGCSVTSSSEELEDFVAQFKRDLRLASPALVIEWVGKCPSRTLSDLYKSDFNNVRQSDIMIAITDEPSIGLGMEIQEAVHLNKPLLCLHNSARSLSRLLGSAADKGIVTLEKYRDIREAVKIAADFIAVVSKTKQSPSVKVGG